MIAQERSPRMSLPPTSLLPPPPALQNPGAAALKRAHRQLQPLPHPRPRFRRSLNKQSTPTTPYGQPITPQTSLGTTRRFLKPTIGRTAAFSSTREDGTGRTFGLYFLLKISLPTRTMGSMAGLEFEGVEFAEMKLNC
jgi:hypothetical protein